MAVLWTDDFESATPLATDYTVDGTVTKVAGVGEGGTQGIQTTDSDDDITRAVGTQVNDGRVVFSARTRHAQPVFGTSQLELRRGAFAIWSIYRYASGLMEVYDAALTLRGSVPGAFPTNVANTYCQIDVRFNIIPIADPPTAFVRVFIDGVQKFDSGLVDHYQSFGGQWTAVSAAPMGDGDNFQIEDIAGEPPTTTTCTGGRAVGPIADRRNEGWTSPGWVEVDEPAPPDDTDKAVSPTGPFASGTRWTTLLAQLADPGTTDCHVLRYRLRKSAAGGAQIDVVVRLRQGGPDGAILAEWVHEDVDSVFTTWERELTPAQAAAITDYRNLFVEFDPDQPS